MSKDLLLEVGTEEIPARFLLKALEDLRSILLGRLDAAGIAARSVRTIGTPRRLAAWASAIPEKQPEETELVLGPAKKVAFDAAGRPTKAAEGFARGQGVAVSELLTEKTDKGEYVAVRREVGGRGSIELLASILPEVIEAVPFPKSMRWGAGALRFARPIHWIVALLGRDVIPFELGGIPSGRESRGHRFIHPGAVKIGSAGEYIEAMEGHGVIVDPADRKARIESEIHAWASTVDAVAVDDPELLDEVTCLVELPTTVRGEFDPAYLDLPREVLITSMRENQKVFALESSEGKLLPHFVSVLNISPKHHEVVVRGNERVLRARLADARFFLEEDRKVRLETRVEGLRNVVLHAKLGSVHDKVERLGQLVRVLGSLAGLSQDVIGAAVRAARLCKADLVTHMVGEFPNLQGIMGREYALADGEPEEVARAIEEHYRPRFSGGPLPETAPGALLAIADKLDALAGCWHAALLPTATQDPYGLRRAALGIIVILQRFRDWRFPLDKAVSEALKLNGEPEQAGSHTGLPDFIKDRLRNQLIGAGYPHDVVEAVISARLEKRRGVAWRSREHHPRWDVPGVTARVEVLAAEKQKEEFASLATTFRRVVNIIPEGAETRPPEGSGEPAEVELNREFERALAASKPFVESRRYPELFNVLRGLKAPVDRFFDEVRVMDPEHPDRQARRLGLLSFIADLFYEIADFSKIVIEQETKT
jgi:glycyl-tRNA synthetase beta chain